MGALSRIRIARAGEDSVHVTVFSVRDDSLPCTTLRDPGDIAQVALVLFVNTALESQVSRLQLRALLEDLRRDAGGQLAHRRLPTLVVRGASVSELQPERTFNVSKATPSPEERQRLYAMMGYREEDGDDVLDDDFTVDVFQQGDQGEAVRHIIGDARFEKLSPRISFILQLRSPAYLERFDVTDEEDSSLDSHILSWLS
jgi:hypothetical protein